MSDKTCPDEPESVLTSIDFSRFVLSLGTNAMQHLGIIPNPETRQTELNLTLAQQTLDILGLLKEKTTGNLTEAEEKLLCDLLHDLRWRFVEAVRKERGC